MTSNYTSNLYRLTVNAHRIQLAQSFTNPIQPSRKLLNAPLKLVKYPLAI